MIILDAGVLGVLLLLVPSAQQRAVAWLYWLNPWFIIHGAFQGFWEGAYLSCGLLAVVIMQRVKTELLAWVLCGAALMCSGMFKPQGVLYFAAPLGLYLVIQWMFGYRRALAAFAAGLGGALAVTAAAVWAAGGGATALYENYAFAFSTMPNLSNGGPNIWRFLSVIGMLLTGQEGDVYDFRPGRLTIVSASLVAGVVCLLIVSTFALRYPPSSMAAHPRDERWLGPIRLRRARRPQSLESDALVLSVLMLGALVMSQFGVRAHINHTYGATVLLIPFVLANRRLLPIWSIMVVSQAAVHLTRYGLGTTLLLPPESAWSNYPHATSLLSAVSSLPAYAEPDALLQFQETANRALAFGESPAIGAMLSLCMFTCTCLVLREFFRTEATSSCLRLSPLNRDDRSGAPA